jgi:hypothetical protein
LEENDVEESGSDLPIDVSTDPEGSSSFGEVSSPEPEQILKLKAINRFCAEQLLYNSNAIPSGFSLKAPPGFTLKSIFVGNTSGSMGTQQRIPLTFKPVVIDLTKLSSRSEEPVFTGLELVPWKPSADAIALKLYAAFIEHQEALGNLATVSMQQELQDHSLDSGVTPGPAFEFEKEISQPSPPAQPISPKSPAQPISSKSPGTKRGTITLPTTISSTSTPLVETTIRRSQRQKGANYTHAWLDRTPTKKHKITALQIDKETGRVGPVKTTTLRSWGLDCGVDPSDLSDEVLMQAPSEDHQ